MTPKVFISYSWSSQKHKTRVKEWADQLIANGIDVVLDHYDLQEGHDVFAFMERMVTDGSVTHVMVICDKEYSEKADKRKAGVGTESQIIANEIYGNVEQTKFIPIVCELSKDLKPFLPTFLKSRIWIDFSSPEKVSENWQRLVKRIYGNSTHIKPELGQPPPYITDVTTSPSDPAITKFNAFRQALLQDKKELTFYREDFLSACFGYADALRIKKTPNVEPTGKKVLEDCGKLKLVRNNIIDWVLLESRVSPTDEFCQELIRFLEKLLVLKSRPAELNIYKEEWFEAHRLFVYETFLYIVAALLKTNAFQILHEVFNSHYFLSETDGYNDDRFDNFQQFYGTSRTLQSELAPEGTTLLSPAAELIKRQADREDIPFLDLIEAELLIFLMVYLNSNAWWFPQTLYYATYNQEFQFFIRATQHKHFLNLATITGISDANQLRELVKNTRNRIDPMLMINFYNIDSFWSLMNMDNLDTIK